MKRETSTSRGRGSNCNGVVESSSSSSSSSSMKDVIEGLCCCPICLDPWTPHGLHQVCCLPCGHVYGMSCITKWIQQSASKNSKCPQCNLPCKLKDVRKLYASPLYLPPPQQQHHHHLHNIVSKGPEVEYSADTPPTCKLLPSMTGTNATTPTYGSRRTVPRKIDGGMVTTMHLFMGVLSLLICLAVYISLQHSIWMFLVTILMFLVAVMMFLVDEFVN